ncbi:MAG: hypothetical protein KatS3mg035_0974 [Bacteroidia bacterium]|nr:MAG: hypothetical protein KatS3mg035_0974 [Bacteroidia bacterium]
MKTIVIHAFDKDSSRSMSETVVISGRTKEQIKNQTDKFFQVVGENFRKFYYEVDDNMNDFTQEELTMLDELELSID